jgi:hypothetical protein
MDFRATAGGLGAVALICRFVTLYEFEEHVFELFDGEAVCGDAIAFEVLLEMCEESGDSGIDWHCDCVLAVFGLPGSWDVGLCELEYFLDGVWTALDAEQIAALVLVSKLG